MWAARRGGAGRGRWWGLPQAVARPHPGRPRSSRHGARPDLAIGDIALIEEQPLPQLAQLDLQMGKHAANQIRRLEAGQPTVPFRYRDKGIMATIGYRSAVVELPRRVRIHGTLAWLAWLALHLITLLGGRNRIYRAGQPVLALPHLAARRLASSSATACTGLYSPLGALPLARRRRPDPAARATNCRGTEPARGPSPI